VKQIKQLSTGDGRIYKINSDKHQTILEKHRRDADDDEKRTNIERATIPAKKIKHQMRKENKSETMYTDESLSQESENETEKGLDINSQENIKKNIIRDDVVNNRHLGNTIDHSDASKDIFSIYKEQDPDANVNYEYGETTPKKHVKWNRADGAGFMADADKYQLVYIEDSRSVARNDKEINDLEKNNKKRLPSRLCAFGGQSFRLRIHLFAIDCRGTYRLNEVESANLPRKFSEMKDFLLIRNVTESFDLSRTEPGPSRLSFANILFQLDE
ncbi:8111_t:CDS:2, partial [Acaulospora morrowiae]